MRGERIQTADANPHWSIAQPPSTKVTSEWKRSAGNPPPLAWNNWHFKDLESHRIKEKGACRIQQSGHTRPVQSHDDVTSESAEQVLLPQKEEDFHFLWEHLHFDRDQLTTDCGLPIRVLHPGIHNDNQGPDFLNAHIEIDGLEFHGHVELHIKSREWYLHGHQNDPNYNNVILHVVLLSGKEPAKRKDQTIIPELNLGKRIDHQVLANIQALRHNLGDTACKPWLSSSSTSLPADMPAELGRERIHRKATLMHERMKDLTGDWEQVVWEEIAATMGGPVNGGSFRLLARALPWKIVRKYLAVADEFHSCNSAPGNKPYNRGLMAAEKAAPYGKAYFENLQSSRSLSTITEPNEAEAFDRLSLEALFFGMAGMLGDIPQQREPWPLRLRLEWAYLSQKHQLHPIQVPFLFHRMRPGAFPTIRLSQLVALLHHFPDLVDLLNPYHWPSFRRSNIEAGRYWKNHLRFGERRRSRPRRMGQNFKDLIVVNTLAPLSLLYTQFHGQAERAPGGPATSETSFRGDSILIEKSLESLPPEDNKVLRKFKAYGEKPANALEAQGLLELHKMYCAHSRCLECKFGQQIIARKC